MKTINKVNESVSSLLNVSDDKVTVFHKSVVDWLVATGDDAHEYSVIFANGKRRLGLLCEQVFEEIRSTVVLGRELKLTYEMTHALDYGHMYLMQCNLKDSFHWLVDMIIVYVFLYYHPKNTGVLPFLWRDVVCSDEDFSLKLRQRISWHLAEFSSIDADLMNVNPCCYLEIVLDHSPKCCFTEDERKIAGVLLGKFSRYVKRYTAGTECLKPLLVKPFASYITAVGVSSSKKLVAVAMKDGTLFVFSLPALVKLFQYSTSCEDISCCTFTPNDSLVLYAKLETALSIAEEKEVSFFSGEVERFKSCAFSPNGKRLITNNHSRTVRIWDVGRKSLLWSLCADVQLECCSFSKTGLFIIGDTNDDKKDSYCVWNAITFQRVDLRGLSNRKKETKQRCRKSERCSRCCSEAQRELIRRRGLGSSTGVYNDVDCFFYLHQQHSLHVIESIHFTTLAAWSLFIQTFGNSPIGNITMIENGLWLRFDQGVLLVSISEPLKQNQSCLSRPTRVLWCSFSPDDTRLASCTSDGFVNLWNVDTSQIYQSFENNTGTSCAACWWSGTYLFVCNFNDEMPSLSKFPVDDNFGVMARQIVVVPLCAFVDEPSPFSGILDFSEGYITLACGETKPVKVFKVDDMENPRIVVLPGIRSMMSIAVLADASLILGTDAQCIVWKRNEGDPFQYTFMCCADFPAPLCPWCFTEDSKLAISFLPLQQHFAIIDFDNRVCATHVVMDIAFTSYRYCGPAKLFCTNRLLVLVRSKFIEMFDLNNGKCFGLTFQPHFDKFSVIRSRLNSRGTNLAVPTITGDVNFYRICHPR